MFKVQAPKEAGVAAQTWANYDDHHEAKTIHNCRANRKRRAEERVYVQMHFYASAMH